MGIPLPTPLAESEVVTRWPNSRRTVPRARRELVAALDTWQLPELQDTALLVLSELVTNAVKHAARPSGHLIETRLLRLPDDRVRIEVHDASDKRPQLQNAGETDEGGRGLLLVDAVTAHQWGVSGRDGIGKAVWAVVGVRTEAPSEPERDGVPEPVSDDVATPDEVREAVRDDERDPVREPVPAPDAAAYPHPVRDDAQDVVREPAPAPAALPALAPGGVA